MPTADRKLAAKDYANSVGIVKLLARCCDSFDFWDSNRPLQVSDDKPGRCHKITWSAVRTFCRKEFSYDRQLPITRYLLCHGATTEFVDIYQYISLTDSTSTHQDNLLKLILLAGCQFDTYFSERNFPCCGRCTVALIHKVCDLLLQPLTLQELSVMSIRQCIGSRQLWAKIDALPVPTLIKDAIKLKQYQSLE